jgi:hypothetical protein
MKVYEVECRAVITLAAQDMQKAALQGAAVIKANPHLIYVRAIHEREPASEDPSPKNSEKGPVVATLHFSRPGRAQAAGALVTQHTQVGREEKEVLRSNGSSLTPGNQTHERTSIGLSFVKSLILNRFKVRKQGRTIVSTPFGAVSTGPTRSIFNGIRHGVV